MNVDVILSPTTTPKIQGRKEGRRNGRRGAPTPDRTADPTTPRSDEQARDPGRATYGFKMVILPRPRERREANSCKIPKSDQMSAQYNECDSPHQR